MHLTNYSINRLSSQYTQNEDADARQTGDISNDDERWLIIDLNVVGDGEKHLT